MTAQQWSDFCVLIGQYDWSNDRELASAAGRMRRITEVLPKIEEWVATGQLTKSLDRRCVSYPGGSGNERIDLHPA